MSKEDWKETGKELGHAFKGLGKTLVKTVKLGVDKAEDWAESEDAPKTEADVVATVDAAEEKKD